MKLPKIENIHNNCVVVKLDECEYVFSYDLMLAAKIDGKIYVDVNILEYSHSSMKHARAYFKHSVKMTRAKIRNGIYIPYNLNR